MSRVRCFWIEPTNRVERWLRRYVSGSSCPVHGYHDAKVKIEDGPLFEREGVAGGYTEPMDWPREDPRWPTHCDCGYVFAEQDTWQLFYSILFNRPDTDETYTLRDAPPGAMWDAYWIRPPWSGPDGLSLMVKLPNGADWLIDGPSTGGGNGWVRTGTPPFITVTPSIVAPSHRGAYHGWLTGGALKDA